ncbi:MAG TPA: ATP-binding protein [Ideonella sp.]|uniref:sensor histidine kinase n=1 Tax=Ideonella sp. TaxID=1929293 RepID=UPI002C7A5868|nr:ATP-binding protein [Ideonella sp.]HSI51738.1 ATP-binding protein [Ideonella sp.]
MSRAQANGFQQEYVRALENYLQAGGESALSNAYELGRRAISEGLGVLDMARLHGTALEELVLSAPAADQARFGRAAAEIFKELLSLFEMSFRGYREANAELQRLNETLRQQKEQLELANRELEAFSYSASHDLRNPLGGIEGLSRFLLDHSADALDDRGKKCLELIGESAQHMRQLIDDLMSLSRVNRSELHRVDVDLSAIADGILARLRDAAPGRIGKFEVQRGMHANADHNLLAVVLENLLGNAWKYSAKRECAEITFGCEERHGNVTYFVRDNGAGFDMAYAGKLFIAFQRLHAASDFEGSGIGLNIVQRIVRRHSGHVWAEGRMDSGATFYFTLGGEENP